MSDNTAFTSESYHTSTFSAGSDQPQPGSSPTLEEQQEGLPEEIKRKTYPSSNLVSAEAELFEDLKEHSLEDSDKVIVVNEEGKTIWAMPTVFHKYVLQKFLQIVNKCSEEENPILARADIPLLVDKKTKRCRHYRLGTDEATTVIEISGRDLGRRDPAEAVRIPLSAIRRVCEKWGLKFEAEATS
ncbi:expressed unknown protein [Seminavis robusta]|uniref:Uncharacterized protein n=1 Tax=Seminavis robusta TaxID=568900 RepID=A0A9N8DJP4_9STRA|nr:expressed unknown protein [Seminavis robusta]|eukprot:Sro180_g078840.1 n/a (186) ;mRNA; r:75636-76193